MNNTNNGIFLSKKGRIDPNLTTIYMDMDDVLLNTSEAMITIFKQLFKNDDPYIQDMGLKDVINWNYDNFIQGRLSHAEMLEIFESETFWGLVTVNKDILELIEKWIGNYNFVLVTKGTEKNLLKKRELVSRLSKEQWINDSIGFIGIKNGYSKNLVDMKNGIQIDDNYYVLEDTNANLKVLFRFPETKAESDYNGYKVINGSCTNLYVAEYVDEIDQVLKFNYSLQSSSDESLWDLDI